MERILIVEDDPQLAKLMAAALEREKYRVLTATDGFMAVDMAPQADLMLLDIGLPKQSGLDVIRELRDQNWNLPILVISAQGTEDARVRALELGADDYLTKPMSIREMLARIVALLRRIRPEPEVVIGDLSLTFKQRNVSLHQKPLELTPTELDLLFALALVPGEVWSRTRLLQKVWGVDRGSSVDERVVDSYIALLRKKLEDDPRQPQYIETVFGQGYRLKSPKNDKKTS